MSDVDKLSPAEAAKMLECNEHTLRRWRRNGYGPPFLKIGRKIRYLREDIVEWQSRQRKTPEAMA